MLAKRLWLVVHCDDAVCAGQKMEKEVGVSERSEFRPLPIFCPAQTGTPQGQRRRGRLSLLTFFGEAKKVSGRRATPGNALLLEESATSIKEKRNQPTNKKGRKLASFFKNRSNYLLGAPPNKAAILCLGALAGACSTGLASLTVDGAGS